jgi:uncharacterized protein (TIGR03067 family)
MMAFGLFLLGAGLLWPAEQGHQPGPRSDREALQGEWVSFALEAEDKVTARSSRSPVCLRVSGDACTLETRECNGEKTAIRLRYRLDPSRRPKWIDLIPEEKTKDPAYGIYTLSKDELKICLRESKRPTTFDPKNEPEAILLTFRRPPAHAPLPAIRAEQESQNGPGVRQAQPQAFIEPLDSLSIHVGKTTNTEAKRQIGGERLVLPDGTVLLGTYGSVRVAGLTTQQASLALLKHLGRRVPDASIGVAVVSRRGRPPQPPKPEPRQEASDLARFQGSWHVVRTEAGGQVQTHFYTSDGQRRPLNQPRWIFRGDGFFLVQNGKERREGTFKIDPKQMPKRLEYSGPHWTAEGLPAPHIRLEGIYKFAGDQLWIQWGQSTLGRAHDFHTVPGEAGTILYVLERDPAPQPAKLPPPRKPPELPRRVTAEQPEAIDGLPNAFAIEVSEETGWLLHLGSRPVPGRPFGAGRSTHFEWGAIYAGSVGISLATSEWGRQHLVVNPGVALVNEFCLEPIYSAVSVGIQPGGWPCHARLDLAVHPLNGVHFTIGYDLWRGWDSACDLSF